MRFLIIQLLLIVTYGHSASAWWFDSLPHIAGYRGVCQVGRNTMTGYHYNYWNWFEPGCDKQKAEEALARECRIKCEESERYYQTLCYRSIVSANSGCLEEAGN